MSVFFTGDDWDIAVTLKTDGTPTDVSGATEIKGVVVSDDSNSPTVLVAETVLSAVATGADWSNGLVVFEVPSASTGIIAGSHLVEIQVEEGGKKKTWPRVKINVKIGTIS